MHLLKIINQNIFLFVQENQFTDYSKERGDKISITPLYKPGFLSCINDEINGDLTNSRQNVNL
jgi:hypothetical protein